ncbi:influenza virus NS1A-binding protein homolog isoform X2 [Macrosteles quadrilineatus]|uniref:influenza virus NS1A-binding protein homolog isoform X2 n=2 Tax=Macrosteles quadrilineatus TaxID=74068 RepID=UPI0023E0FE0E|nr:influenza virus NS1A-binding protein homolog isoform X2 [Macrosteles quadrilineatus]
MESTDKYNSISAASSLNGSFHSDLEVTGTGEEMTEQSNGGDASPTGNELLFMDDKMPVRTLHSLNMMRKNRTFCDVILHVGNSELHGHRAVLASASPHLLELFSADDETKGVRENIVTYHLNGGFDKLALEKLIDYAYTARLEVRSHQVKSVFQTATKLKMDRVAKECARHLIQHMDAESCIEIRSLPGIARNKTFVAQVDSYIAQQFEEVSQTSVLLALPCVRVEVLNQTRQEMSLVTCESLCHLVLDWVKRSHDDENVNTLTEKTHLLYLALDNTLQDCSELPSGDVSDTEIVQDYKKMSKKTNVNPATKNRRKGQIQPAKPRVLLYNRTDTLDTDIEKEFTLIASKKVAEHSFLALVSVGNKLATLSVMLRLNQPSSPSPLPDTQTPVEKPDLYCGLANMVSVKCGAGCANLNNNLLVCGGYDRAECLRSVELYDPEHNTWGVLAPMREARGRFNIAVVGDKVYAVGGCNGTTELATVECYDPQLGKWTRVTSLSLARSNTGVCELGGKLYCIGGWNGQVGIKQCDVFDPDSQQWTTIASLLTGRYQAGVCAMNDKVWAVGGCDGWNCLTSVETYDPQTDLWTFASPMITARRGCGVAVFKGKLYAVGGSDGTHSLTSTEMFDPETQTWSPGPNMTTPRSNVGVTVINGRLYAVGGFSGKTFLNSIEYLDEKTDEWTTFSPSGNEDTAANGTDRKPHVNGHTDQPISRFSFDKSSTHSNGDTSPSS